MKETWGSGRLPCDEGGWVDLGGTYGPGSGEAGLASFKEESAMDSQRECEPSCQWASGSAWDRDGHGRRGTCPGKTLCPLQSRAKTSTSQ